ncbi:hypothetical protein KAF25_004048 [Fusarium avenaceum]|uniref:Transcription factor domain-containing protein n=1 Tax=Fusarium avenaceum TaxID=40199 RepID=A0A9P7H3X4_9HYPO|nr:hypothetical protein KAF25_004048 [Fusarium avenaceum]
MYRLVFRHQTSSDIAWKTSPAATAQAPSGSNTANSSNSETWKRPVSPPARDRATTFFMRQYVFDLAGGGTSLPLKDNHEFLPGLIRSQSSAFGLLSTTVAAAGFAALSNAGNVAAWRAEGFRLYSSAIHQLQSALQDSVRRVSDETLGAVLLMGTFESIAFTDTGSLKASSQHIIAAARCIDMRGPQQFETAVGLKLFMQMRRIMITTCHQLQEPIPFELAKWSRWAAPSQPHELIPVNRFSEINEVLASVRAELKYQSITDPAVIAARLLPIDSMFEDWAQNLPLSWEFRSYRSFGPNGVPSSRYDLQCDVYSDPWIACVWNSYRNVRLLIHESIIIATLKNGTEEQKGSLQSSVKVLRTMADDVCHSAAYHLGYRPRDDISGSPMPTIPVADSPCPGGFLLLWPLFFAAIQRTTTVDQREWVGRTLRQIGVQMGLQLGVTMANLLENDMMNLSFSHSDTFLLGEWYPN